jgi:hypothetical protein
MNNYKKGKGGKPFAKSGKNLCHIFLAFILISKEIVERLYMNLLVQGSCRWQRPILLALFCKWFCSF